MAVDKIRAIFSSKQTVLESAARGSTSDRKPLDHTKEKNSGGGSTEVVGDEDSQQNKLGLEAVQPSNRESDMGASYLYVA